MTPRTIPRGAVVALLILTAAWNSATGAADELVAAPADAWPTARGTAAGTGRSGTTLVLPLGESWQRTFDKTAFGAVPVIAADTIYLGDLDGTFRALALDTGATRWEYKAEAAGFPSAAALPPDAAPAVVVVGDDTGVVRAFDTASGTVRWEYATQAEISGGPTIVRDAAGDRVLVGSQDASLSCLSLADGTVVWKHSIADQIRCSPTVAVTADGLRVFLAGCDGKLHVLDAATGMEVGAVAIDGPTGTTPAAADGRVFFGTEGGGFFAIDFLSPDVAWKVQPATGGQSYRSSAALTADAAIVGSRGKAVEAFARSDGSRRWKQPLRGRVDASPVIVAAAERDQPARETVVVADASGTVLLLDAESGAVAWEFAAGGRFDGGAAVAAGRIVIASDAGTVWCFGSAR